MSEMQEVTINDLEKKINSKDKTIILSENEESIEDSDHDNNNEDFEDIDKIIQPLDNEDNVDYERRNTPEESSKNNVIIAKEENEIPMNTIIYPSIKNDVLVSDDEDNSSSEEEEEDSETFQKLEQEINRDILLDYHPESKFSSYNEILAQSLVVRNKNGEIIDALHTTIPFLTKYEKARILGVRAKQLNNGADPFITIANNIIEGHIIAEMELDEKKLPFIIRRPLPNGGSEYWKIEDLELLEY